VGCFRGSGKVPNQSLPQRRQFLDDTRFNIAFRKLPQGRDASEEPGRLQTRAGLNGGGSSTTERLNSPPGGLGKGGVLPRSREDYKPEPASTEAIPR